MADTTDTSSILDLPGARDAINYLTQQFANFQRIPLRLQQAVQNLTNIKRVAEGKGLNGAATAAANAIMAAQNVQQQYAGVAAQTAGLMDELRTSGLLAGTLDTITAAIGAATGMASLLSQTDQVEQATANLANNALTPQERAQVTSGLSTGSLAKYLLLGAGVYAAIWAMRRGAGTRRF